MHSKSDNIEIMNKADEVIEVTLPSLLFMYQIDLETAMEGSSFIFDHVYLLYCKCHKIDSNCGGSYIDSPDWIKNKNKSHQQKS